MKKVIYISYAVCAIAMFVLLFYMFGQVPKLIPVCQSKCR